MAMKGVSKEFVNKLILITLAGILIWNFDRFLNVFSIVKTALTPLLVGMIFAIILHVPMDFFEKKVFKKLKKYKSSLSLACAVILFAGILTGLGFLVFLKLVESIGGVASSFQSGNAFEKLSSDNALFKLVFENLQKVTSDIIGRLQEYVPKMLELAENIIKIIINLFLGLFLAILILSNKKQLSLQFKKLIYSLSKKEKVKDILDMLQLAIDKFSSYIGGQLLEAMLLGMVCYLVMSILGLPFAPLIAAITALVNLVPMVGAYIGGGLSALLIFSVSPEQALVFVIFIVILQQIESVTTYPVIVGRYVGLSSFWILTSVVVGGGLFGFIGVFLSVPVMAFLHDFIGGILAKRKPKTSLVIKP